MSRVNASKMAAGAPAGLIGELHPPAAPTETAPAVETAAVFPEMNPSEMGEIHSRQIVVDTELSATQLSLGHEVKLTQNLASVFAEGVANVSFKNKAIVTGIDLCNVYSSVPKRVSVGINLFSNAEQKQGLRNETGWLYSSGSSDFAVQDHVGFAGDDGSFTNLASLLPMEQARHAPATQLYNPCNSELTSRQLSDYGNITSEKQLWEGIVPVTDDLYYVPAESVVCKVVSKNWDRFGFHPEQEEVVEGNFYRISKPIVNSVVKQLYENVIAKLPYTKINRLKLHLQSNVQPSSARHQVSMQLKVSYRYPNVSSEQ